MADPYLTIGVRNVALDSTRWTHPPPPIAPGVLGYVTEVEGVTWVVLLQGAPPGQGHVGRYLDSLTGTVYVVEPNVRMMGMLERRRFEAVTTRTPLGEIVKAWKRNRNTQGGMT